MVTITTFRRKGLPDAAHIVHDQNGTLHVKAEDKVGFSDWPIRYDDRRIAWDHPERFPKYVKNMARKAFNEIDRLRKSPTDEQQ